ncbi:MAG: hypothetical protein FE041_05085 [Thermoplasmata archaeon]|nr:MAG: hypothetical protein FE041_05085 [Thermoplasmata archaeon]
MIRLLLIVCTLVSLLLPILSYRYFYQIMKLIKVRIGSVLVLGALTVVAGYIFFILPWIFVGDDIEEIRFFSYSIILLGLSILTYGVVKIYLDWKEVMK